MHTYDPPIAPYRNHPFFFVLNNLSLLFAGFGPCFRRNCRPGTISMYPRAHRSKRETKAFDDNDPKKDLCQNVLLYHHVEFAHRVDDVEETGPTPW
jgi:hypothetical protein